MVPQQRLRDAPAGRLGLPRGRGAGLPLGGALAVRLAHRRTVVARLRLRRHHLRRRHRGNPREQYEAAALAGAGRLRRFRDVTLPHLVTPTIIILALRTAWNVAEFAQPFELTGGGPGTRTMLMSILTYETAYVNLQFSRAYTLGMAMIVISMAAAIFYVTVIQDEEELYV
ncbi:ABC transporter permease subunit [Salinigranum rubrum]|uniref:ABC transporter permease subunit n=1 Tax=Salinigranum rubrum TaxID=755307 RepID=UPI002AA2B2AC|nr:ABC transporter permease subunit [Salinigranum rubrum]